MTNIKFKRPLTALVVIVGLAVFSSAQTFSQAQSLMQVASIDVCQLTPTFTDDFDTLSVAGWDLGDARWIAHTPWYGDFGDALFTDPQDDFPFTADNGILRIEARKGEDGTWRSGLLSSVDPETDGFSQTYGYFEARMKLPDGPGVWPAFWLGTNEARDRKEPGIEVDVLEYYGHAPDEFQSALHVWFKTEPASSDSKLARHKVPSGSLTQEFHTYGVDVREDSITYYLDRQPIRQELTPDELKAPLFPLVNLALGSGFPIEETPNPSFLYVDYVHVYSHEAPANDRPCER